MRIFVLLLGLSLSHPAFASDWQTGGSTVAPAPVIKIADETKAAGGAKPGTFQIRGFYRGMTLGEFSQQMQRQFGQEVSGLINSVNGYYRAVAGDCSVAGHSSGATDVQMAALASFTGSGQTESKTIRFKGPEAVATIKDVSVKDILFPGCVFGPQKSGAKIFEAVEAFHPLPADCRRLIANGSEERSYCFIDGSLLSFGHGRDGEYDFWMLDPVSHGPEAEAAGVKPP